MVTAAAVDAGIAGEEIAAVAAGVETDLIVGMGTETKTAAAVAVAVV